MSDDIRRPKPERVEPKPAFDADDPPETGALDREMPELEENPFEQDVNPSIWAYAQYYLTKLFTSAKEVADMGLNIASIISGGGSSVAGIFKMIAAVLTMFLTSQGVNLDTGVLAMPPGAGWILFVAAGLYLFASAAQGILSSAKDGVNWETTVAALSKAGAGTLAMVLLANGIDISSGQISVNPGGETPIVIAMVGYFVLSGTQAFLTSGVPTVVGAVKALAGIVATILLSIGVDVSTGIPQFTSGTPVLSFVLYGIYIVLSIAQALMTKDAAKGERNKRVNPAFSG